MLCTLVLNGLVRSLRVVPLDVGDQFDVVTVSFDPRETAALAAAKKKTYVKRYARAQASQGWHFLTGEEASIQQLTRAVGFRYAYDEKSGEFAHATGIMVLTPTGRLARYFYGIDYSPRDLRLALVEASAHKIGSVVDQLLLFCFHYDPKTGKYSLVVMNALRRRGDGHASGPGELSVCHVSPGSAQTLEPEKAGPGVRDEETGDAGLLLHWIMWKGFLLFPEQASTVAGESGHAVLFPDRSQSVFYRSDFLADLLLRHPLPETVRD